MNSILEIKNVNAYYGVFHALKSVSMSVRERAITAIIGPSGCGKSTLVRSINRMNDHIPGWTISGEMLLDGENLLDRKCDLINLRKRAGMVFQRPNPFPISVFENVAYGPRIHGTVSRRELPAVVEKSLRATGLWDEVKDRLDTIALRLSPEQQQRLCISRLVAVEPEVLLMDEPCSALDPAGIQKIEELMQELKKNYTIVIVTHNMHQAARVSDETGFMLLGDLVEFGDTVQIFEAPRDTRTEEYITGRYG
ncbi:MAG: phosphate ABC transporter ATP-binding protein PstB [Planctomycetota bacterium]|nr:phosphate ABC transporter ATP-binding protein PstB [Planctomycetota bacterium]